ncbi:NUDIX domain-containing protein [Kineosporia succinea]|uniref:ADP-ribose pyrophosphatase YjhB (NUDIX family) n=1 Tax=Kineosporia succinea TaxID=84632 RepID=A0ABT9P8U3_9ACTN|nr:NUDIX hydrolase [Kineosporia succinea]MDP9828440.1 ADP-ribose pyrophosphatase YjhB (NUDIX family) [Kineosporia succinea]
MSLPPVARPVTGAGALITDGGTRLLLVKPTYKDGWEVPGGFVEPDESPAAACARELREEIGLDRPTGRLLVVDWAPAPPHGDKLLFVFDGGVLRPAEADALVVDGNEISEARFVELADLPGLVVDRLARRLEVAWRAQEAGLSLYAEHGRRRPGGDRPG